MVHEITAVGELSRFVESYWEAAEGGRMVLPPDGTHHLLLAQAPIDLFLPQGKQLPAGAYLCHLPTTSLFIGSASRIVGIRLKAFARLRPEIVQRQSIQPISCFPAVFEGMHSASLQEFIPILQCLVSDLVQGSEGLHPVLREKVNLILEERGNLQLSSLAGAFGVSRQALHKEFLRHLGVSPKQFASIWKFNHFLALSHADLSLTHAALDAGYFDQAHAINAFRKQLGAAPSRLPSDWVQSLAFAKTCIERRFSHGYDPN